MALRSRKSCNSFRVKLPRVRPENSDNTWNRRDRWSNFSSVVSTPAIPAEIPQFVQNGPFSEGLQAWIRHWRSYSIDPTPDAWVFPSEKVKTPVTKDNCWRRDFLPKLKAVGLEWVNFHVMRQNTQAQRVTLRPSFSGHHAFRDML